MDMSMQIMMMGGGGGSAGSYYFADHGVAARALIAYGADFDASDNTVTCGAGVAVIGTGDGWVTKSNNNGAVIWTKAIGFGSIASVCFGVAFDNNGDVIVAAYSTEPGYGSNDVVILKLSGADGSITWQREFGTAGSDIPSRVAVDSSDNIYCIMNTNSSAKSTLAKWNSGGTLQWQRNMNEAGNTFGRDVAVDSSGNVYVAGNGATSGKGFIAKYNSSGTIQWQYVLNNSTQAFGIEVDSSGNIYVLSSITSGTTTELTKLSSTPAVVWTRKISAGIAGTVGGVALDSSNNIYITFSGVNGSTGSANFAKYNNSGTIQWQRAFAYTTAPKQNNPANIKIDNSDTIVAALTNASGNTGTSDGVCFRAANDGDGDGVYGPNTYYITTLTEAVGSVTITASSLTEAAGSASEAAGNLSIASSGITVVVTPLV